MKSKTLIEKQTKRKTNSFLVSTIRELKKKDSWLDVAGVLSGPRRKRLEINLSELDNKVADGETVLFPGKILSEGEMTKKIKIIALNFSKRAEEKLKNFKCETVLIEDELNKNPEAKGIKILK